jgi:putative ABC transport system substrate-binding protein
VSAHLESWTNRLIVELAEKGQLPAFYPWREVVEIGGLMACAFDLAGLGRAAADAIDQILKRGEGRRNPISRPNKFVLSINVKTAKTLGLTVPTSLLARADEVIE